MLRCRLRKRLRIGCGCPHRLIFGIPVVVVDPTRHDVVAHAERLLSDKWRIAATAESLRRGWLIIRILLCWCWLSRLAGLRASGASATAIDDLVKKVVQVHDG